VLEALNLVDEVVAVDRDPSRLHAIEASFPGVRTATDIESVVSEIDAVIVATPPETHAGLALWAMDAGKHVLVEKPMATTVDDAWAMVDMATQRDVALAVGHTFEYNAAVWALRDLLRGGELGRPLYIDTARLNLGLYQARTNVIWDLAPHDISIINYLLDDTPSSVRAWGSKHLHHRLEDVGYLRLEYERRNVQAHVHVSWLDPCKVRRVTVVGDRKMAVYNDLSNDEPLRVYDKGLHEIPQPDTPDRPHTYRVGSIVSPHVPLGEPLGEMDAQFLEAVEKGAKPTTDGLNGLAVVEVLEAADKSLREDRVVTIEEISDHRSSIACAT
jgi:predicted dehydrogenase